MCTFLISNIKFLRLLCNFAVLFNLGSFGYNDISLWKGRSIRVKKNYFFKDTFSINPLPGYRPVLEAGIVLINRGHLSLHF